MLPEIFTSSISISGNVAKRHRGTGIKSYWQSFSSTVSLHAVTNIYILVAGNHIRLVKLYRVPHFAFNYRLFGDKHIEVIKVFGHKSLDGVNLHIIQCIGLTH